MEYMECYWWQEVCFDFCHWLANHWMACWRNDDHSGLLQALDVQALIDQVKLLVISVQWEGTNPSQVQSHPNPKHSAKPTRFLEHIRICTIWHIGIHFYLRSGKAKLLAAGFTNAVPSSASPVGAASSTGARQNDVNGDPGLINLWLINWGYPPKALVF